ncbi:MAG: hypothetical protein ACK5II_03705 [Paracoccus sp. (in: a-proteobacteria)]
MTFEDTVSLYINATLTRDGSDSVLNGVTVDENGDVSIDLSGTDYLQDFEALSNFLNVGKVALQGGEDAVAAGQWGATWRLFLPLGLAIRNNLSTELLHFPPDYTLEGDQDYLLANTLIRWGDCLIANGADAQEVDRYQTTIDIAPIGADSGAGSEIDDSGVLGNFSDYANQLLALWSNQKPLVVFGGTARTWFNDQFGLGGFYVGDVVTVDINGAGVFSYGANHPSYFYNAIDSSLTDEENYETVFPIMYEDLIAAKWQVDMAASPTSDPNEVATAAREFYDSPEGQAIVCQQVWIQGFEKTQEEAEALCLVSTLWSKPSDFQSDLLQHEESGYDPILPK